ncbi:hypothetical protein BGZ75_010042 [Mortierella antarctica]|nr:hypothetical protein BGZ67_007372 [Mortierella alpina]KAF9988078.1 hypothetical protein BGZ75_010042 [Mortierella antarctica]
MSSPTITPEVKRLSKEIADLKRQIDTENAMIKMYEDSASKTKTSYLAAGQAPSARLLEREKIRTQIRENSSAMRLCIQSTMSQHCERLRALEQRLASLKKAP